LSSATSALAISTDRGSGSGAEGTDVMPAPSRWDRVRLDPMRLAGRLPDTRAEPIGELSSCEEPPVRALADRTPAVGALLTGPLPKRGSAGVPHTSQ
jgi:hypothetical protein